MKDNKEKNKQASTSIDSKKLLRQQRIGTFFSKTGAILFLLIMSVVVIIPFYWMINTSFKTETEQLKTPPTLYPHEWTFENYKVAFLGKNKVLLRQYERWIAENPAKIEKLEKELNDNKQASEDALLKLNDIDSKNDLNLKFLPEYINIYNKILPYNLKIKEIEKLNIEKNTLAEEINKLDDDAEKLKAKYSENHKGYIAKIKEKDEKTKQYDEVRHKIKELNDKVYTDNYYKLIDEDKNYKLKNEIYQPVYKENLTIRNTYAENEATYNTLKRNFEDAQRNIKGARTNEDDSFKVYIFHTLVVGISSTILGTLISIIGAFALSRLTFKGRDTVFSIMLATMMIPGEMMVISNFITVTKLKWTDGSVAGGTNAAYLSMVVPFLVTVFHIYLLRQTFKTIPDELYYAAKVDGTSDFKYLWKVMVPLAKSSIITITILKLMGAWNAYIWPNLVAQKHQLITVWLRNAFSDVQTGRVQLELQMAATVLVLLPLLFVFIFLRKYIMRGVSRGGTKG